MNPEFILVDFENVQPMNLGLFNGAEVQIKVFLGRHQAKIPVAMALALHALGPKAEYIQRTLKTLRGTIKSYFANQICDEELDDLIGELTRSGTLTVDDGKCITNSRHEFSVRDYADLRRQHSNLQAAMRSG